MNWFGTRWRVVRMLALMAPLVVATRRSFAGDRDPAAATALFQEGRAALEAKDYATACPKLEESMRLDPHVGTLISLAQCDEGLAKIALARTHWQQAVDLARAYGDSREAFAAEQLARVDLRVPRLTLRRSATAPPEMSVKRDGADVSPSSQDLPLPVEPGSHDITIVAPGYWPRSVTIELAEAESKEVILEPGAPLPSPAHAEPAPAARVETKEPTARPAGLSALRVGAIAVGAGGLVGLGLGSVWGVQAISGKSGRPGVCDGDVCDAQGARVRRDALTAGDESTVAFIIGGALVATGVVLWVLAPSPKQPHTASLRIVPAVGSQSAGVFASGRFE